jgi:hypothetical protein
MASLFLDSPTTRPKVAERPLATSDLTDLTHNLLGDSRLAPTECRQPAINGYFGRMARYAVNERFVV